MESRNAYDLVHYETHPRRQTHPDRLAAVARLFGMETAPVANCSVLEIGCGDGGNLIPMAYYLPGGRFVGVDLAAEPIAAGRQAIESLGLRNVTLEAADLRAIGPEYGEFDYIFAHGLYSWVPAEVRDRLLAVCGERLAPKGVAFVSYNLHPGRYFPQLLRDMLRYHTRQIADAAGKIERGREFLKLLSADPEVSSTWRIVLQEESRNLLSHQDGNLFHDDLAEVNDPVYFHEFVEHAAQHGLQYLGEAEPHDMFDPNDMLRAVDPQPGSLIEREQYLDFLKGRRFRRTLLCREGIALQREIDPALFDSFLFSPMQLKIADGVISNEYGSQVRIVAPSVERVVRALNDTYPLPVEFAELVAYAGATEPLREILYGLMLAGMVNLHVHDFACQETVTERPEASGVVRYEASRRRQVTNVCHTMVYLDDIAQRLVGLLDGTRDLEKIAEDLAAMEGMPAIEEIRRGLPQSLDWMARIGLLVA